jgi:hypothetical protein
MIQVQQEISLRRQCELLAVGRSGLYYEPVGTSAEELALMRRIDEIHLEWPFYGSRKLCEAQSMPSPWRWMYAQLYNWNLRKWGRRNDPELVALAQISTITVLHSVSIFAAYLGFTHERVPHISRARVVVLCLAIGFFFYVRFHRRGEADSMIAELKLHDADATRRDFRKLAAVVFGTLAVLVLAMAVLAIGAPHPKRRSLASSRSVDSRTRSTRHFRSRFLSQTTQEF